ncbi:unnamed protein product [Rotaria sp. Silwood2]|nr:unnamed protein product [Rotaria sp. Silwood2]CAF4562901.1 unnamed protein product [Rotaria sp. Silwood2]
MASNDEYEIVLIENEIDACLCAKLLAEEFAAHNPLSIFNQATAKQSFDQWAWPFMINALDKKLSFLIGHRSTNEIVAVIIASNLFLYCEKHPYDASSPASHHPTNDLLAEMLDQFIHPGATRSKHSGKTLGAQLRAHVCTHARNTKGFQYAFIQTCNPATRHIHVKKMNGKEMTILDPATWLWKKKDDGLSCPFKDYKDEPIVNIFLNLTKQQ